MQSIKKELKNLVSDFKNFLKETDKDDLTFACVNCSQNETLQSSLNSSISPQTPLSLYNPPSVPPYQGGNKMSQRGSLKEVNGEIFHQENDNSSTANPPLIRGEQGGIKTTSNKSNTTQSQPNQETRANDLNENKINDLDELKKVVSACQKCPLSKSRLNAVFGVGNPNARIMFVGEGPGFDEDHKGEPFVGKAGKLLDKIITAMGFERKDVYIANIVKCHPMINPKNPEMRGNDRPPTSEESNSCIPYLEKQISIIKPKYIVALGSVSAKILLDKKTSLGSMRGVFHEYPKEIKGLDNPPKIVVTYHPAALLRNPNWKKPCWQDMKMLLSKMRLSTPNKK